MSDDLRGEQIRKIKNHKFKKYQPQTCIENYSYMLIRPPRLLYNQKMLNPAIKYGRKYTHEVHLIPFDLSLYLPKKCRYVILYLHGNSSCRLEGYKHLAQLPQDVGLACFDFDGCGIRTQHKYITLGKKEATDVDTAYNFLTSRGYLVAGWGRSMGAVSLLLSSQCKVLVVDSPFSSLKNVCKENVLAECPAPLLCLIHCCFPCFFQLVGRDVKSKVGMDLCELQILDHVKKMDQTRCIGFVAAKDDNIVNFKHSKLLHDNFKGKKSLIICEGNHNSIRSCQTNDHMLEFIEKHLFFDSLIQSIPHQSSFLKRESLADAQTPQTPALQTLTNLISNNELSNSMCERIQQKSIIITKRPIFDTARM